MTDKLSPVEDRLLGFDNMLRGPRRQTGGHIATWGYV